MVAGLGVPIFRVFTVDCTSSQTSLSLGCSQIRWKVHFFAWHD